jgi:hypothetical protein
MIARCVLVLLLCVLGAGCSDKAGGAPEKKQPLAFPVQVTTVEERPVEYAIMPSTRGRSWSRSSRSASS